MVCISEYLTNAFSLEEAKVMANRRFEYKPRGLEVVCMEPPEEENNFVGLYKIITRS